MFSVIICLLLVLAEAWAMSRILNRRIEECVPVFLTGTIVFLYIFYCLNLLFAGRIALYVLCIGLFCAGIIITVRRRSAGAANGATQAGAVNGAAQPGAARPAKFSASRFLTTELFTPGIILLLALSALFIIYASSLKPSVWDELRLWAAMPKALHFSQALQVGEGSLLYSTMQSYPPGMALLVYFFTAFTGSWSDGAVFAVYWIFAAALILPATKKLSWKQWYVLFPAFAVLLIVPYLLTVNGGGASGDWAFYYTSLYIEPSLGCLFGAALYQAANRPFSSGFSAAGFALSLFVLPAFKNVGAVYAIVCFASALVLWGIRKIKEKPVSLLFILISAFAAAASYFSWQLLIHSRGTGEFIDFNLSGFTAEKLGTVLKGLTTWGSIPFLYYMLFFLAAALFLTLRIKEWKRKEPLVTALALLAAFLIFFYGYTSHYGLMLSSIHRYTSVFTFACFTCLFMRAIAAVRPASDRGVLPESNRPVQPESNRGVRTGVVLIIGLLLTAAGVFLVFHSRTLQLKNETWIDAEALIEAAKEHTPTSYDPVHPASFYLALGGDIRKESQRHETCALEAIGSSVNIRNIWCDKIFNEAEDGVVEDPQKAASLWAQRLLADGYEYVVIARPDPEILDAVGRISPEITDLADGTVLRILPAENPCGLQFEKQ